MIKESGLCFKKKAFDDDNSFLERFDILDEQLLLNIVEFVLDGFDVDGNDDVLNFVLCD